MTLRALFLGALTYVVLLTVIAFAVPLALVLGDRVEGEVRTLARSEAGLVADAVAAGADGAVLGALVDSAARSTRGRVIVVDRRGRLLGDSARPPAAPGADYASRPEVAGALRGRVLQERRDSESLGRPLLVTAVPVGGQVGGAVRVSQDVGAIGRATRRSRLALVGLGLLVLALGAGAAALLARRLSGPLAELEEAAGAVAAGDMAAAAPERGSREQVAVARAFNAMTSRLDRTLTAQQEFVANASHQLRTPLTGVRLRLEEALAEEPTPAAREHLLAASVEVDRLAATIDDLLVLGRSGERPQSGRPVALAPLAEAAAARFRPAAAQLGRTVTVALSGDEGGGRPAASVIADPADLDRILDALLENAVAYGDGPVEIVVDGARLTVLDRGPGLAAGEDDGRLLSRFARGSAGRRRAGTGLGLSIASTLAARWGATVSIAGRPGGGAAATLDLSSAQA